jgi:hypothetical protein
MAAGQSPHPAQIHQHGVALGADQDVGRFHVTVDDRLPAGGGTAVEQVEGGGHRHQRQEELLRLRVHERPGPLVEGDAVDPVHDQVQRGRRLVGLARRVGQRADEATPDGDEAGDLHLAEQPDLVSPPRRPFLECIWAGRAVVSLSVAKAAMAPATLAVSSEDPPSSRYGSDAIELALLTRSEPRVATLRVT